MYKRIGDYENCPLVPEQIFQRKADTLKQQHSQLLSETMTVFFLNCKLNSPHLSARIFSGNRKDLRETYVAVWRSTGGEHGGVAFTVGCGLQALPCLDLCQQLRVVSGGGHHVEGFGACREKDGDGKLKRAQGQTGWR